MNAVQSWKWGSQIAAKKRNYLSEYLTLFYLLTHLFLYAFQPSIAIPLENIRKTNIF